MRFSSREENRSRAKVLARQKSPPTSDHWASPSSQARLELGPEASKMVQLDMSDSNLISRTIELVKSRGLSSISSAATYNSTSGSPSKTSKKHRGLTPPQSPTSSTSGSRLISYPINPVPHDAPFPVPLPCRYCLLWCCGGNMKWFGFPILCAFSLGIFLAFSKAAAVGHVAEKGYSQHLNSRQLSEDEPAMMPQNVAMLGNKAHMLLGDRQWNVPMQMQAMAMNGGKHCDCSKCDEQQEFFYPTEARYRKLVKHSLQHFYGTKDLALYMSSFVPKKKKLWNLGFALYTTASGQCEGLTKPQAVVLVMSESNHKEERETIRKTWGSVAKGAGWPNRRIPGDVRLIFVVSVSKTRTDNELVTQEAGDHGDVILVDIPEGPDFATKRVLSGFKWVQMYCQQAQYVIKVDENVFLDLPRLLQLLANQEMANMIYGPITIARMVPRVVSETNKIVIPQGSYIPPIFPPYSKGFFYAMPTALSKRLVEVAEFLPYLILEDVFVTGVLAKVFDARHLNVPEDLFDRTGKEELDLCDFVYQSKMAVRIVGPEMAESFWRRVERPEMCGFDQGAQ